MRDSRQLEDKMKYLEDFQAGQVFRFRTAPMSKESIMGFAREWDPQQLHLDEEYATKIHGGLIASGFQTLLEVFKPIMTEMMTTMANIGGMGFDNFRWLRPVHPDEPLDVELIVNAITPSRSKPDRGILQYTIEARNPDGELVFTTQSMAMMKRKPALSEPEPTS